MQYLSLENVSRFYGEKVLFDNVNLSISKGDKIALVAKNGSGKSTLLRVIAGEEGSDGENAKILISKDIRIAILGKNRGDKCLISMKETVGPMLEMDICEVSSPSP